MLSDVDFVLSTNPPNPKTSFRLGDWICSSPKCAAHNFGRNLSCIGCGSHRSPSSPTNPPRPAISSPRFSSSTRPNLTPPPPPQNYPSDSNLLLQKPSPHHPLLTPSGRAFAVGGKVQNISTDPLNPCIMFWPENEPFPDQGQIRPSGLVGIPQPPILNTGNRGPISHQPGDWICQKCNYLNWRRRKVCQTCLPYAEGNGDSISAAVQAERIALLTNVLARTRLDGNGNFQVPIHPSQQQPEHVNPAQRSHSLTPPAERTALASATGLLEVSPSLGPPTINLLRPNGAVGTAQSSPGPSNFLNKSVHRSRSHFSLGQQYQHQQQHPEHFQVHMHRHPPSPIYQTPLPLSAPGFGGPELISPQQHPSSLPQQQQHFQNQHQHQQAQIHRNPSPLSMPLLYSTGPPASPFLSPGFGVAGHRTRVLSTPAVAVPRDWAVNTAVADSVSSPPASGSAGSGSVSSLGSLDVRIEEKAQPSQPIEGGMDDIDASGSEMPTPAINTPLLPAFLRDVVSSPLESKGGGEEKELLGNILVQSPKSLETSPVEAVNEFDAFPLRKTNVATFPLTAKPLATHPAPQIVPRARNDSGSSTCSTSSSSSSLASISSSNVSTSGVSHSATSHSSGSGCGGSGLNVCLGSNPRSSSTSPTVTTTVSSRSTPPADTSTTSFMSFGDGGIWKMDGEESKSLTGFYSPPPAQPTPHHRHHQGFGAGHHHELQTPLPLPVGAERRMY